MLAIVAAGAMTMGLAMPAFAAGADTTTKEAYITTTGIIMNTLPYVLMVALCAAALFGFVAFKRKKVQK